MTMHKLTAGDGYQYLIRQVAAVDSTSRGKAPLIDYYSSKGESPGHWVGSGLASLESTGARWVPDSDVADVWAVAAGLPGQRSPNESAVRGRVAPQRRCDRRLCRPRVECTASRPATPPNWAAGSTSATAKPPSPAPWRWPTATTTTKPARTGTRPSTRPPAPRSAPSSRAECSPNSTAARPPTTANSPASSRAKPARAPPRSPATT